MRLVALLVVVLISLMGSGCSASAAQTTDNVNNSQAAVTAPCPTPQNYVVTDLGSFGDYTYATAINNTGQVVGYSGSLAANRAFLWQNGKMTNLGTLSPQDVHSYATGLNEDGLIVGSSWAPSDANSRGFIWKNGAMTQLNVSLPAPNVQNGSAAAAVNEKGQVVGNNYLWDSGRITELVHPKTPFGGFQARAINNNSIVVGSFVWDFGSYDLRNIASIWSAGTLTLLHTSDIGGDARSINDWGQVIYATLEGNNPYQASLWQNGHSLRLGSFYPEHINACGQTVGSAAYDAAPPTASSSGQAVIWSDGKLYDLNTLISPGSGWTLNTAHGINDWGQIVGEGTVTGNATPIRSRPHAFLLTPVAGGRPTPPSPVVAS